MRLCVSACAVMSVCVFISVCLSAKKTHSVNEEMLDLMTAVRMI